MSLTINCKGKLIDLSVPKVMGILNVTPDSFYDGGIHARVDDAIEFVEEMHEAGADFIDVGAMSSRPGAVVISEDEELERLIPVVSALHEEFPEILFSIDTCRAEVANVMVNEYGIAMVNDISGGNMDEEMFATVAALKVPYVMMHMKGIPNDMQTQTGYADLMGELMLYFSEKVSQLHVLGVKDIIIDPGFGFSKTTEQNYEMLSKIDMFKTFGLPILAGVSRKSMVYKELGVTAADALNGTTALHTALLMKGINILRVHDVKEAKETIKLTRKLF